VRTDNRLVQHQARAVGVIAGSLGFDGSTGFVSATRSWQARTDRASLSVSEMSCSWIVMHPADDLLPRWSIGFGRFGRVGLTANPVAATVGVATSRRGSSRHIRVALADPTPYQRYPEIDGHRRRQSQKNCLLWIGSSFAPQCLPNLTRSLSLFARARRIVCAVFPALRLSANRNVLCIGNLPNYWKTQPSLARTAQISPVCVIFSNRIDSTQIAASTPSIARRNRGYGRMSPSKSW